ncbi:hypothetical protein BDQ17DRAFT_1363291 [Cyathus striatus]|nr:hypothetical protein BDQ17DRAFT_1363291 [Cyathus striatus]
MGQYWRFYNIDKREKVNFESGTKLPEWFFSYDPIRLLNILRRNREENWCDDRIICFGDYADLKGLRYKQVKQKVRRRRAGDIVEEEMLLWEPQEVYSHLGGRYDTVQNLERDTEDISPYVLRNMSKKMYVRGDGAKFSDGKTLLGHCLFSRICWSSDPSSSMSHPFDAPEITRGLWAGDRFDVVLFEDVKDALESERWKDITKQIKAEVESTFDENSVGL